MKTVGFPISRKENERRRALIPQDAAKLKNPGQLYIESGYGEVLGYTDDDYAAAGCHITDFDGVMACDIICDAKIGDEPFLADLRPGQTVFGWVHAVQHRDITDAIALKGGTAYCWEDMFEDGRHVFWRNNEIAGEAAVVHAFQCWGKMAYHCDVALIGRGNVARGALKILDKLGANVMVYDRRTEKQFQKDLGKYDVLVNGILWDTSRTDHIIYREDLQRMRRGSLIIDISCDTHGGVETSEATTIEDPTYVLDGVTHYVVDHTPALFYKTVTESLSAEMVKYLDELIEDRPGQVLIDCRSIHEGRILDQRIIDFQHR